MFMSWGYIVGNNDMSWRTNDGNHMSWGTICRGERFPRLIRVCPTTYGMSWGYVVETLGFTDDVCMYVCMCVCMRVCV